jgi:CubicO group peptidase (beta-lactamase class C family)
MKKKILSLLMVVMLLLASCDILEDDWDDEDLESYPAEVQDSDLGEDADEMPEAESSPGGVVSGSLSARVDGLMSQFEDGPGGVVMVIQDGKIVHKKGYGLADVEQDIPITPETIFHLGSVGKQFTAMGVLILVEQGRVDLDDPISAYIPELDWMDPEVTVRSLLHHTSGVMGHDDSDEIYDALLESSDAPGNEDVIWAISQYEEMLSDPGDEFYYNNTGYDLLGSLIERVSGQTYARFMDANVFAPLGMKNTFALPNERRFGGNTAESYDENGQYEPDVLDNLNGSGSIYSTVGDMYLYDQALYTEKLVSRALLDEMFTSGVLNNGKQTGYGFGFDVAAYNGYDYVGHQGSWLGFDAYYLRFPAEKLSVVVLLNLDYAEPDSEKIAFAVADLYLR